MIKRRCPYCDQYRTDLTTHLKLKHKNEKEVILALQQNNSVSRNRIFAKIRNEGMEKTNKEECLSNVPTFERKRRSNGKGKTVMCSKCKIVLLSKNMARHKKICSDTSLVRAVDVMTLKMDSTLTEDFKSSVIGTLRDDEISSTIKKDDGILLVGIFRFNRIKKNKDKAMEIRRSVRNDMRRLALLYTNFKVLKPPCQRYFNSVDMFNKENFSCVRNAVDTMCENGDDIKAGLKVSLKFLVLNAAKILEGHFLSNKKDKEDFDIR